jgi:hypothetical protein
MNRSERVQLLSWAALSLKLARGGLAPIFGRMMAMPTPHAGTSMPSATSATYSTTSMIFSIALVDCLLQVIQRCEDLRRLSPPIRRHRGPALATHAHHGQRWQGGLGSIGLMIVGDVGCSAARKTAARTGRKVPSWLVVNH